MEVTALKPLTDELKPDADTSELQNEFWDLESSQIAWYVAVRAVEEFRTVNGGSYPEPKDWEAVEEVFNKVQARMVPEGGSKIEGEKYCKEMCRFSDSQLHNTGAFLGGVAA